MARRTSQPVPVTAQHARQIWINAQRLDQREPFGSGPDAAAAAIRHLGYVQIDTINVIERCHHHILFSRIPQYQRSDLEHLQSTDKRVFEYWTHALSYIPAEDIRFFLSQMKSYGEGSSWFASLNPADVRKLLTRIKREGPISIRDIEEEKVEKTHLWASRKPSKRALQLAFYQGRLAISQRSGMVKTYELMERHFEWSKRPRLASETEILNYKLDRALRSQGLVCLDSICHLEARNKSAVRQLIDARIRRKELLPIALEGAGNNDHWAKPETLEQPLEGSDLIHILSPFDPLIIQRKRLKLIFGYDHLFEAYVPQHKRKLGYFALPVLIGDEIVAAIDLKADRANRTLLIQNWVWTGEAHQRHRQRIEEELDRFAAFQFAR